MSEKTKILLVEDDLNIADIVEYNLYNEGFEVLRAEDGPTGLHLALTGGADLILLDVMLPGMDGYEILRRLRKESDVPVIMLTAREAEEDRIAGFEAGADDYVPKPFSFKELILRIHANLRRVRSKAPEEDKSASAGLILLPEKYTVLRGSHELQLSMRDFMLLQCLMEHPGRVFSREELLEKVWGFVDPGETMRMVDTAITRLREKIEDPDSDHRFIETRRGAGYYYNEK
ncbi:MAG: response regulator transcription factor [Clostridia bacterium]|nr:response regulator transcription factor [Clostridia bacterium]